MNPTFESNLFTVNLYAATGAVRYLPNNCYHNRAHVARLLTAAGFNKRLIISDLPQMGSLWDELKLAILHCTQSCRDCMGASDVFGVYPELEASERATAVMRLVDVMTDCNVCAAARAVLLCHRPASEIGDNLLAGVLHDLLLVVASQDEPSDIMTRLMFEARWTRGERYGNRFGKKLAKFCKAYLDDPRSHWCTDSRLGLYYRDKLKDRAQTLLDLLKASKEPL